MIACAELVAAVPTQVVICRHWTCSTGPNHLGGSTFHQTSQSHLCPDSSTQSTASTSPSISCLQRLFAADAPISSRLVGAPFITFGHTGISLLRVGLRRVIPVYFMLMSQVSPQACFTVISVGTAFDKRGIEKIDTARRQIDAGIARWIQSCFFMVIKWVDSICHGIDGCFLASLWRRIPVYCHCRCNRCHRPKQLLPVHW